MYTRIIIIVMAVQETLQVAWVSINVLEPAYLQWTQVQVQNLKSYYKCLDNLGDEMDTAETEIVCDNGQQVA